MTEETTFIKCPDCQEYLHVTNEPITSEKTGKILIKKQYNLECPACGKRCGDACKK
jgi:hypothetical protein